MTVAISNPYLVPDAWKRVSVGGSLLPGILTAITVGPRKYAFTKQKDLGGTEVTVHSTMEAIDGIKVDLFLRPNVGGAPGDFELLRDGFMPLLIPGWPNKIIGKPRSFPFDYPGAQWLGVKRAHLTELHAPGITIPGDPSYWYSLVFQEDLPKARIVVGPTEPAKINGPLVPTTVNEVALYQVFAGLTGQSLTQVIQGPQGPATATASGSAR
jgi:hypothetical protein